jgi:hypothetical protein
MMGPHRRAVKGQHTDTLEDPVDDRMSGSSSWSTRPQAVKGLFVVKIIP